MNARYRFFGWIETLWLVCVLALVGLGLARYTQATRQSAVVTQVVENAIARERVIAAEVTAASAASQTLPTP